MNLSDTQTSILRQAARHPESLVASPAHLQPGPRGSIARALLNSGLVARTNRRMTAPAGSLTARLSGWASVTPAAKRSVTPAGTLPLLRAWSRPQQARQAPRQMGRPHLLRRP